MLSCSHLASWLDEFQADPSPREVRDMVRDMNCATSQKVFIGESTASSSVVTPSDAWQAASAWCI